MYMHWIDWSILGVFIAFLVAVLFYCNRYIKSPADFLAANRCAGRYVLSISADITWLGTVSIIGAFEMYYVAGFTPAWWYMTRWPVFLFLALTGWLVYRYRETRVFTLSQLFEARYSKKFRIFTGILAWVAGIINYGIFPAVTARFFIYFCGLPETYSVAGVTLDTYASMLFLIIAVGVFFATVGGQVAITVTDFIQGMFCNIMFIVLLVFVFVAVVPRWDSIINAMTAAPEGISLVHPYRSEGLKAYNAWYWVWGMFTTFYSQFAWQGSRGYACAAKTPHENRMASLISGWRGVVQALMLMMIPAAVYVIMYNPSYQPVAEKVNQVLSGIANPTLRTQMLTPTALGLVLPVGMLGLFATFMAAISISADDTNFHSWGSIFIQDVVAPLRKKPFTTTQHIFWLRISIVLVGALIYLFGYFFRQVEYLFVFLNVTFSIFVSGAGVCIIGALYWKKGTAPAAWTAMITGAVLSLGGMALQQIKPAFFLKESGELLFNSQQIYITSCLICTTLYVVISLLTYKQDYNLEKLLHRGKYDKAGEHGVKSVKIFSWKRLGLTDEFTLGDKIIYFAWQFWQLAWLVFFLGVTIYHCFGETSVAWWSKFWHFKAWLGFIIGVVVLIWICIGGIFDLKYLFWALGRGVVDEKDDGRVSNGNDSAE